MCRDQTTKGPLLGSMPETSHDTIVISRGLFALSLPFSPSPLLFLLPVDLRREGGKRTGATFSRYLIDHSTFLLGVFFVFLFSLGANLLVAWAERVNFFSRLSFCSMRVWECEIERTTK